MYESRVLKQTTIFASRGEAAQAAARCTSPHVSKGDIESRLHTRTRSLRLVPGIALALGHDIESPFHTRTRRLPLDSGIALAHARPCAPCGLLVDTNILVPNFGVRRDISRKHLDTLRRVQVDYPDAIFTKPVGTSLEVD